jgi:glycine reductase
MVTIGKKLLREKEASRLLSGEAIGRPTEDCYFPRGVVKNEYIAKTAAERGVDMLLAKLGRLEFVSELAIPKFERIPAPAPVKDLASCEVAVVSDGGLCAKGNPQGLSGRGNKVWCTYEIDSFFSTDIEEIECEVVHTGYYSVEVLENPFRLVPVDVLQELEREGVIGKLHSDYFCTSGNATVAKVCHNMGTEMAAEIQNRGVEAVILTST